MVGFKGGGHLSPVKICAPEDIVGSHLLVGRAVTVEVIGEDEGEGVVGHQAVCTVATLQLF
ncbi:MAG: hypothetical protein IKR18_10905, partial [Bacteroidaceae bacterium]|nr:hypothetical protein [Bacteroidaceae bacterium]